VDRLAASYPPLSQPSAYFDNFDTLYAIRNNDIVSCTLGTRYLLEWEDRLL
jgi:hypothetical protein